MDREELTKLLKTPLDPDLDYYDATASIEAMANHIRDLHKLINYLFESVATQGASVLATRKAIVEIKGDLAAMGVPVQEKQSSIIMPPRGIN